MAKFFRPNLERAGRTWRGILGALLLIAGIVMVLWQLWAGIVLIGSGVFVLPSLHPAIKTF